MKRASFGARRSSGRNPAPCTRTAPAARTRSPRTAPGQSRARAPRNEGTSGTRARRTRATRPSAPRPRQGRRRDACAPPRRVRRSSASAARRRRPCGAPGASLVPAAVARFPGMHRFICAAQETECFRTEGARAARPARPPLSKIARELDGAARGVGTRRLHRLVPPTTSGHLMLAGSTLTHAHAGGPARGRYANATPR